MRFSICRCCGDKITRASLSNPNICLDCEHLSFDVTPRRDEPMPLITLSGNLKRSRPTSQLRDCRRADIKKTAE